MPTTGRIFGVSTTPGAADSSRDGSRDFRACGIRAGGSGRTVAADLRFAGERRAVCEDCAETRTFGPVLFFRFATDHRLPAKCKTIGPHDTYTRYAGVGTSAPDADGVVSRLTRRCLEDTALVDCYDWNDIATRFNSTFIHFPWQGTA